MTWAPPEPLYAVFPFYSLLVCIHHCQSKGDHGSGDGDQKKKFPADPPDPSGPVSYTHLNLYINSPGGSVTAGMAIYDTMNYIKCDVCTTCIGMAASMGAFLLSGGAKGKRFALPNAEIMIHQPSGGAQGQATEINIAAEHILKTRKKLNEILAANTGTVSYTHLLKDATMEELGRAKSVKVQKENTIIVDGLGNKEEIANRIGQILSLIHI